MQKTGTAGHWENISNKDIWILGGEFEESAFPTSLSPHKQNIQSHYQYMLFAKSTH